MEPKSQPARRWLIPALLVIVILLLAIILVFVLKPGEQAEKPTESGTPKIGYAEGVTAVDDQDALQQAVNDMLAKAAEGTMDLEYKNDATSEDGEKFTCYIANAASNRYDMYIQIFADAELTDQLYLSGLVRPGQAFRELDLEHALDSGSHTVYVAYTQVEEDLETIHSQVLVTMNFIVTQ